MTDQPGYTRVPNALLDLLPLLPDAECRVVLAIVRKTIGWQKACDVISYTQLEAATRMSRQGVINGIEAAIKRGILKREPSGHNNGFCYEIVQSQVVNEVDHLKQSTKKTSQRSRPHVVNEVDHLAPQVVNEVDTQKKDSKEKKERGARADRATPTSQKKRTRDLVFEALAEVCGIDWTVCTTEQRHRLNQAVGKIRASGEKAGKTTEEIVEAIRYVAAYCRKHVWPCKDGQTPTPKIIQDNWGAAIAARQKAASNGHVPTGPPAIAPELTPEKTAEIARRYDALRGKNHEPT